MEKIKKITINLKRWQAGMMLSALALLLSYILAATCPSHRGAVTMFHLFGMVASGGAGTFLFVSSVMEMWDKWDA
jgi:hypothetical protein